MAILFLAFGLLLSFASSRLPSTQTIRPGTPGQTDTLTGPVRLEQTGGGAFSNHGLAAFLIPVLLWQPRASVRTRTLHGSVYRLLD